MCTVFSAQAHQLITQLFMLHEQKKLRCPVLSQHFELCTCTTHTSSVEEELNSHELEKMSLFRLTVHSSEPLQVCFYMVMYNVKWEGGPQGEGIEH